MKNSATRWNSELDARIQLIRPFIAYVQRRESAHDKQAPSDAPFRETLERWTLSGAAHAMMQFLVNESDKKLQEILEFCDLEGSGCLCGECADCHYDAHTKNHLLPAIDEWKSATDTEVLGAVYDMKHDLSCVLLRLVERIDEARERLDDALAGY